MINILYPRRLGPTANIDNVEPIWQFLYSFQMAQFPHLYTSNHFLAHPSIDMPNILHYYCSYSGFYDEEMTIQEIFEREVFGIRNNYSWMGIWGIHALASVMGREVRSIYPGHGAPRRHLNRVIAPRQKYLGTDECEEEKVAIIWTHTHNTDMKAWWQPNHFVPCIL